MAKYSPRRRSVGSATSSAATPPSAMAASAASGSGQPAIAVSMPPE